VGDALGMPVEGWGHRRIASTYGWVCNMHAGWLPQGAYTDDTEMMIGIAESWLRCDGFDAEDMVRTFLQNYDPRRGYGISTLQVFELWRRGVPHEEASLRIFDGGSYGNGAAMRIAPIGLLFHDDPIQLRHYAEAVSRLTHAHPIGIEGAVLQAYAIATAVNADPQARFEPHEFVITIRNFMTAGQPELHQALSYVLELLDRNPTIDEVVAQLGNDTTVHRSMPTALYAFAAHWHSFEEAVSYAVNLGGDADTIGAMTGAIAGAFHGVRAIPKRWWDAMSNEFKGRDYIVKLAQRLYELWEHKRRNS
ncbi:MAG TPA: hypothetical protein EYP10_07365, partial [Armatimonadetes bacterium]|nr:hypothetical protein [Armatimonadota bacterium]